MLLQPRFGALQLLLFQKLKSPLKGKRFQTIHEIQENTMGQLMATRRTVWGLKVLILEGTEVSWSYVQCFLYLVCSSINVSVFHRTWLDTFWTDHFIHTQTYLHMCVLLLFVLITREICQNILSRVPILNNQTKISLEGGLYHGLINRRFIWASPGTSELTKEAVF